MSAAAHSAEVPPDTVLASMARGCPFCGGAAAVEPHAHVGEVIRIRCATEPCLVRPGTEYLLREYWPSLLWAWNGRGTGASPSLPATPPPLAFRE